MPRTNSTRVALLSVYQITLKHEHSSCLLHIPIFTLLIHSPPILWLLVFDFPPNILVKPPSNDLLSFLQKRNSFMAS